VCLKFVSILRLFDQLIADINPLRIFFILSFTFFIFIYFSLKKKDENIFRTHHSTPALPFEYSQIYHKNDIYFWSVLFARLCQNKEDFPNTF